MAKPVADHSLWDGMTASTMTGTAAGIMLRTGIRKTDMEGSTTKTSMVESITTNTEETSMATVLNEMMNLTEEKGTSMVTDLGGRMAIEAYTIQTQLTTRMRGLLQKDSEASVSQSVTPENVTALNATGTLGMLPSATVMNAMPMTTKHPLNATMMKYLAQSLVNAMKGIHRDSTMEVVTQKNAPGVNNCVGVECHIYVTNF